MTAYQLRSLLLCWASSLAICMGRRLRQNDTNISEIYIRRPIYISDVQYIYQTSNIYIRHPISISDVQYLYRTCNIYIRHPISISDIRYLYRTSDIYIRHLIYNNRLRLGQGLGLGQEYRTSDIDIGRRI